MSELLEHITAIAPSFGLRLYTPITGVAGGVLNPTDISSPSAPNPPQPHPANNLYNSYNSYKTLSDLFPSHKQYSREAHAPHGYIVI